ncbi:MAG: carboxypeptidase-like regulatory domain-containing protein, partial [Anaerolineales bacterium]|nr:carboxypeptidase-like regulatory domain-containing protein [Anaerolineales bacterium]
NACTDGLDNDCDGLIDQNDQPDCCTIINRECKQYTQNVFDIIHTKRQTPQELRNIQKIESNYYACVPDDTDTACCINPNSCVYDSVCYDDRVKLDVDGDGITEVCVASSPGEWMDEFELECTDSTDNDFDGKTDCEDEDCSGSISGNVQDADTTGPIFEARIDVTQATTVKNTADTNNLGNYHIGDVLCTYNIGAYDMIASKTDYVSSTQNVELVPREDLTGVDFTLTLGTSCEDDCTYAGDNTIHRDCDGADVDGDGIADCVFCGQGCDFCDPEKVGDSCDLAQPGWIRPYDDTTNCEDDCEIECAEGCPMEKLEIVAGVTCDEENLIKTTKLVDYKGKLAKLVIVTCG